MDTKIKIGFQELEYNNTVSIFYANKDILFNALQEAERIVGTPPAIKTFMNGFVSCVMDQIKNKHIDAAKLGLSDEKLLSLFNYDLKKLIELESFYNFSITKEPTENDFAIFAETPEEISRLKKWSIVDVKIRIVKLCLCFPFYYVKLNFKLPI